MKVTVENITAPNREIVTRDGWKMTMKVRISGAGPVALADAAHAIEKFIKEKFQ